MNQWWIVSPHFNMAHDAELLIYQLIDRNTRRANGLTGQTGRVTFDLAISKSRATFALCVWARRVNRARDWSSWSSLLTPDNVLPHVTERLSDDVETQEMWCFTNHIFHKKTFILSYFAHEAIFFSGADRRDHGIITKKNFYWKICIFCVLNLHYKFTFYYYKI